jgi:hypothetical protein
MARALAMEDGPLQPARLPPRKLDALGLRQEGLVGAPAGVGVQLVRLMECSKAGVTSVVGNWCVSGSTQTNAHRSASQLRLSHCHSKR